MKCWEYKGCGREEGGVKAVELGVCPAYPNGGDNCWMVAGTLCGGQVQGTFAEKMGNCRKCEFYEKKMMDDF